MTQVTSAQANKILQAALFTAANRSHSLVNMLTEEAPKGAKVNGGKQTSAGAPVVRITDLTKQRGDSVDMQLFHQLSGRPSMGDQKLDGRLESLSFADFALKINQTRHGVDAGGKMSQQRTKHDLIKTARTLLADGYYGRLVDQRGFAQLAGARGDTSARIFSTNFGPELVSIAGVYRTFERGIPQSVGGRGAQLRQVHQRLPQACAVDVVVGGVQDVLGGRAHGYLLRLLSSLWLGPGLIVQGNGLASRAGPRTATPPRAK